jgi:signal transduction histidine kinase
MSEPRVADLLRSRLTRLLWAALTLHAVVLTAVFALAGESVLRRSLEHSADVIQSLLGRYADPQGERTGVAPAMLADQLLGTGDAFLITRAISEGQGQTTTYFLTADMPAKTVAPGTSRIEVHDRLVAAIAERGRWRHRLVHRQAGEFDIYVVGRRAPNLLAAAVGTVAALLLLPLALMLVRRAAGRSVSETLIPLDRVVSETGDIAPRDLSRRLTMPTGVRELTILAETINQLVDRVEHSQEALKAFTADASHELRTPLTHMRAQAQWALAEHRGLEETRDAAAAIVREVDDTTRMIEDLLLLARGENRQLAIAHEPFDVSAVVQEVEEITRAMAVDRQLDVRGAARDATLARGDALRTRQILLNLATNAVRYTSAGSISFAVQRRAGHVGIAVRDTGIGIGTEHLGRIFDRFFRIEPSRARSMGGTGLGLTIARLLAELQSGHIEVASQPGKGSTFTLWLAAADQRP